MELPVFLYGRHEYLNVESGGTLHPQGGPSARESTSCRSGVWWVC